MPCCDACRDARGAGALLEQIRDAARARGSEPDADATRSWSSCATAPGSPCSISPTPAPAEAGAGTGGTAALPEGAAPVPEIDASRLTPGVVRAAIAAQRLPARPRAPGLAATSSGSLAEIDRAYAERERHADGDPYEPATSASSSPTRASTSPSTAACQRPRAGAACGPPTRRCRAGVFDAFERAGLLTLCRVPRRAARDLGQQVPPAARAARRFGAARRRPKPSAWHQDGAFLGPVTRAQRLARAVALRRRGPGHGPRPPPARGDVVETGTPRARPSSGRSRSAVAERGRRRRRASPVRCSSPATCCSSTRCSSTRPRREPGMTQPRYAVESWFFGPRAYPEGYAPIAC